ncbi:alpha/beta hydrolase [Microbacterium deminutum]|uniref:AB hydrolase-1 domain-containing protein n=1 Tax=Microbacterium deminutum TaxID=344164 RepID=A0ABN2QXU7_9MICO
MITKVTPDHLQVPVTGGELHALTWGSGDEVIVAIHGISASAVSVQPLADRLASRYRLVAPDLRGRGGSARLPGPFGMAAHAADMVALLDHLGIERATVIGESMGGYVAVQLTVSHPGRVERLVLVDGGLPLPIPEALLADPDAAIAAILGPALARLRMTFESRDAYRTFWQDHPALRDVWNPYLDDYVDADLTGEAPRFRSVVSETAVVQDGRDQLVNKDLQRLSELTCPVTLVRAGHNLLNEPTPLFGDETVAACIELLPQLVVISAPELNHYSLMLTDVGADLVAGAVLSQLSAHSSASD